MKAERIIFFILASALLWLCAGGYAAAIEPYPPLPEAIQALKSGPCISVTTVTVPAWSATDNSSDYYYAFQPRFQKPTCGFVFYPGAYVDPRAYAPSMREIAEAGYFAVIVKMPGDLAVYGVKRAANVIAQNPDIENWVIGGHSLGATAACMYINSDLNKHLNTMQGLVVWASTAATSIANYTGKVLLIYGTNDGDAANLGDNKDLLPADTRFILIQGGNHTYCGWYGDNESFVQPGDNPATITHEDQQAQLDNATLVLLNEVSGRQPSKCPVVAVLGKDDPAVAMLRRFRDSILAQSAVGRKVIQIYYKNADSVNAVLDRSPVLRTVTRRVLEMIAPMVGR